MVSFRGERSGLASAFDRAPLQNQPTGFFEPELLAPRALYYHPESKIVHHKIRKAMISSTFRDILTTGAEWLEKHRATKWLSDDRDHVVLSPEDNEWGDKVWAPRVIKAGFKYWAVVAPENVIGRLQMNRFVREYRERGVTVELFKTVEEALVWLKSVD